jgi:hypothetical protein
MLGVKTDTLCAVTSRFMIVFVPFIEGLVFSGKTLKTKLSMLNELTIIEQIVKKTKLSYVDLGLFSDSRVIKMMSSGQQEEFIQIVETLNQYIIDAKNQDNELIFQKEFDTQFIKNLEKGYYPIIDITESSKEFWLQSRNQVIPLYSALVKSGNSRFESNDIDSDKIPFPEIIQYFTIIETDKILLKKGLSDYSINEVSRSTHPNIGPGEYFYAFDDSDNLLMINAPYRHVSTSKGNYIFFDSDLYNKSEVIVIPKSEIISFKLYGTELMQSSVKTNKVERDVEQRTVSSQSDYQSPSIIGTALSAFLFGSAYTILKGVGKAVHQQTNVLGNKLENLGDKMEDIVDAINSISISTDHQIIDTSRVQIVLSNRRDLEIDGINIYYDLNRMYPELGNDSSKAKTLSESQGSVKQTSMTDEIMKLKTMLDDGIIDEEEFKEMKKKFISKI